MPSLKLIIAILVAITLTAVVTYFATTRLSNPVERDLMQEFKATPPVTATPNNQDSATDIDSVDVLLVGLKQRLEAQPDDVDGWVLLSKSYYHLNRMEEAKAAFEKAKALGYTGSWQPLPRIDSFSQNSSSSINFRDYKINEDSPQSGAAGSQTGTPASTGLVGLAGNELIQTAHKPADAGEFRTPDIDNVENGGSFKWP
jgi:hypothetical protein